MQEQHATGDSRRNFWCNQQWKYPYGSNMCTTACMQVAMAILCGQLSLARQGRKSQQGLGEEGAGHNLARQGRNSQQGLGESSDSDETAEAAKIVGMLNWCMQAGSVVHGRVGAILNSKDAGPRGKGVHHVALPSASRMISVNDLITLLGINMDALNVGIKELLVCSKGLGTRMVIEKDGLHTQYAPEKCFIGLSHLPLCMVPSSASLSSGDKGVAVVALVTANCHTVCCACYCCFCCTGMQHLEYALFDPMPGQLAAGLSGDQLVAGLKSQLGIPPGVCGQGGDVSFVDAEEVRREKAVAAKQTERVGGDGGNEDTDARWEDCCLDDDGVTMIQCKRSSCGKKKARKKDSGERLDTFYCDVTILYMK